VGPSVPHRLCPIAAEASAAIVEPGRHYKIMEVCGGHTHSIYKYGVDDLLPANVELVHGPGDVQGQPVTLDDEQTRFLFRAYELDDESLWRAHRAAKDELLRFMGLRGAALMAVAALDTACWDIVGRLREEPLWSLLGGARREVRCYASDSLWLGCEVGALAGLARARTAAGFDAMKVRIGSGRPDEDARRVAAVRDAVGGDVTLMADANQGWSRAQAIETGALLAGYGLHWLEEPVPAEDYESLRPIHEATGLPIATGESWFGMLDVEPGLATGAVSFLMPDLERMGGVSGWATAARA